MHTYAHTYLCRHTHTVTLSPFTKKLIYKCPDLVKGGIRTFQGVSWAFSKKISNLCLAVLGLHWCAGFSGCGAQASHCGGFSLWRLLLLRSTALGLAGFSSCSTQAQ